MSVSIRVQGIPSTKAFLSAKNKEGLIRVNKAIMKAGFYVQGEVQESIAGKRAETRSVDTGRFLNSVKNVQKEPLTATIETNVPYAKHLEYGTSRIRPRRHFKNSAVRSETKVKDFIETEIKRI